MYSTLIDCESLHNHLDDSDWLVIDTRYDLANKDTGRDAYDKEHIPGAIYLDLHDDLSGPPVTNRGRHPLPTTEAMNALFSRLGITPGCQVVTYDNVSGSFAARLWWMLQHMQHRPVAVLDGGWQEWLDSGYPVDTSVQTREPSQFSQVAKTQEIVSIDEVNDYESVFDSRDPARFRGEVEPIDKAAGHIPGAVNRFWKQNLDENGRFKSGQVLESEFLQLFGDKPVDKAVFYCGSGVTACHNLLAVAHAGLGMPRLYAGSWSEWSNSPDKPVATGG